MVVVLNDGDLFDHPKFVFAWDEVKRSFFIVLAIDYVIGLLLGWGGDWLLWLFDFLIRKRVLVG